MKEIKSRYWIIEHSEGVDALETEEKVTEDVASRRFEEITGLKVEYITKSTLYEIDCIGLDIY